MPEEEKIKIKEEPAPVEDLNVDVPFQREVGEFVNETLNRRLYPINVPLVGRSVKLKDDFVLSGLVAASATVTTVSTDVNGATQTNLATFTFLPDEIHFGMLIRITALGTYTADATRTVTVRVGAGNAPTTEWNSMVSTAAAVTTQPWHLIWTGIVSAIGSSGTVEAQMVGKINNVNKDDSNTATVSLNTTTSNVLAVTAQWSASTAGNSITIRQFILEILN